MVSPKLLNVFLALQVLTTLMLYINALPITSKPIESTAENIAWQAWLMLPPDQKNLEKSRKVTPKSIFTLPFRDCPPGHHLFENRCIPTVQIDQTALLTQEVLGFIGDNVNNNYDFDYDDLGEDFIEDIIFDAPQKLSGVDGYNDTFDQLPTQDEPLKFNIFQQKFPTDYDGVIIPNEDIEELTAKSTNATITPPAEAVNSSIKVALNLNSTAPNANNSLVDLQMDASNISKNIENADAAHEIVTPTMTFSVSDIDAIILPAVPASYNKADLDGQRPNVHKFSLFKDDSSVQLVTTSFLAERNNERSKQPDLTQLLKADGLMPLSNVAAPNVDAMATTGTTTRSRTSPNQDDNEVTTFLTSFSNSDSTTTPLSSSRVSSGSKAGNINELSSEATDMMLSDVEATMPTLIVNMQKLENADKSTESETSTESDTKIESQSLKKAEHPRSVTNENNEMDTSAQEDDFLTTTEADSTTNFQLDETTVQEEHDAPTITLKELLELAHQSPADVGIVKKSKVEPVEPPPLTIETIDTITDSSNTNKMSASSMLPTTTMTPTSTPLPVAASIETTDRFGSVEQKNQETSEHHVNNDETKTTETTTAKLSEISTASITTAKTSEIDIEQELRMINELVKGNSKRQQQLKAETIKSTTVKTQSPETTFEAESGTIETTSRSAIESSKDSLRGSLLQVKESSTTAIPQTIQTTTSIQQTTTPTESTSTIWSKIVPLFGYSSTLLNEETADTDETTMKSPRETENTNSVMSSTAKTTDSSISDSTSISSSTSITSSSSSSSSSSTSTSSSSSSSSSSVNNNRSNRNSKIIRINSLSSFSSSASSKNQIASSDFKNNNIKTADKLLVSPPQSVITPPATATATDTKTETETETIDTIETTETRGDTTTESLVSTTSEIGELSDSKQVDPFWWLPTGWRLDRSTNSEYSDPSLLLRFWSAFPGQQK